MIITQLFCCTLAAWHFLPAEPSFYFPFCKLFTMLEHASSLSWSSWCTTHSFKTTHKFIFLVETPIEKWLLSSRSVLMFFPPVHKKDKSWLYMKSRPSGTTALKKSGFCHGNHCMGSRTLAQITVCEHSALYHPQTQVKDLQKKNLCVNMIQKCFFLLFISFKMNWSKIENCSVVRKSKLDFFFSKTWMP